jgi:hypothetical protein
MGMEGYGAKLQKNGIIGQVKDIHQEGGGVVVNREHGFDRLEGISELEEEMGSRFWQVVDGCGMGPDGAAPCEGHLIGHAVGERVVDHGGGLHANEMNEQRGANFDATA